MKILVVVDMQNDFIDGALGTPEAQAIVPAVAEKIKQYSEDEEAIILYTMDTHFENYLETQEGKRLPVMHCIQETEGWNIKDGLYIPESPYIIKSSFGAWDLGIRIQSLAGHETPITSIEFVGLCTDICVISNVMIAKAFFPEAPIIVDSKCCAGVTPASHENALNAMKMCHIDVI